MDTQTALQISEAPSDPKYREAIEHLIDHRDELKRRIYVEISPSMKADTNPDWDKVRAGTKPICNCGNERVILPGTVRSEYEPGQGALVELDKHLSVRPVGSDKESCVAELSITTMFGDEPRLLMTANPYAPGVLPMLSTQACKLSDLKSGLRMKENDGVPILEIGEIDVEKRTMKVTLDKDMEAFDASLEPTRHPVQVMVMTIDGPDEPPAEPTTEPPAEPTTEPAAESAAEPAAEVP